MGLLSKIESILDRGIGIFSPMTEGKRLFQRERLKQLRSTLYAGASTTRLTGDWSPTTANINELLDTSSRVVRARVRQLVRDFPYFQRALNVIVDYTVGEGVTYQSRVRDRQDPTLLDNSINVHIEEQWKIWMEEADISGKLHFNEFQRLVKRQDAESGEFIVVKRVVRGGGRLIPFALQIYEAEWLTEFFQQRVNAGNLVDHGIEYNMDTGEVVAYHFQDPIHGGSPVRIVADQVIHDFEFLRPGQRRGISVFVAALLMAKDLNDYMDAEMDAAKLSAKWLAFITSENPAGSQDIRSVNGVGQDQGKQIEDLENATIEYLQTGEKIEFQTQSRPGSSFGPFVKLILRMMSVSTGISYELLSGDYEGINFSNLRGIRNDVIKTFRPIQQRHIRNFCEPIKREFLNIGVLSGALQLPGFANDPRFYWRGEWTPPGIESVDALREAKAHIEEENNLTRSPQERTASRGRNYEDVLDEIVAAKKMREARGLEKSKTSTAMANNPAAIAGQSGHEDGEEEENEDEDEDERMIEQLFHADIDRTPAFRNGKQKLKK